jgi:hypothetical protein
MMVEFDVISRKMLSGCAAGLIAVSSLSGCSPAGLAVGAMTPILENTKVAAFESDDIRTFNAATPSNLLLLEGLIQTRPDRRELRLTASMLYFSYAFTFDDPADMDYASTLYSKGFGHGRYALFDDKEIRSAWDAPFDEFVEATKGLTRKDLEPAVWTVANWSQLVALHLDSTQVLVEIPRLVALLERAVEIDGAYFQGLPYMILGSLHAFRPPLMGGDPEASRENFEAAFRVTDGKFLLAHYFYAKFYCYRIQDAEEFESRLRWVIAQPDSILPEYRLLNVIAKKKAAGLLKEKDELF